MKKIFIVGGGLVLLTVITLLVIGKQENWSTQPRIVEEPIQSGAPSAVVKNTLSSPIVALSDFQSANCISKSEFDANKRMKVGINGPVVVCDAAQTTIDQADNYVVSMLGEKYFSDNIKFVPSDTEQLFNLKDKNTYWSLAYTDSRFMQELGQPKPIRFSLLIEAKNHEIVNGRILPDCVHDKALCAINITAEKALATAKAYGLDNSDPSKFEYHIDLAKKIGDGWTWYFTQIISREKGKMCGISKTFEINISTGKTSDVVTDRGDCVQPPSL